MSDSLLTEAGYCDPWRVGLQGPAPASSPWTRPLSTTLKLHTFPGSVVYFIIMKNVHWDNQQVNKSSHLLYLPSLLGLCVSVVWNYRYEQHTLYVIGSSLTTTLICTVQGAAGERTSGATFNSVIQHKTSVPKVPVTSVPSEVRIWLRLSTYYCIILSSLHINSQYKRSTQN